MAVLDLGCTSCGHRFRSLVMAGTKTPDTWVCSSCGSAQVHVVGMQEDDPFSRGGPGCACGCG